MSVSKFACYKCGGKTFEDILKHNYDFHIGRKDCSFCGKELAKSRYVGQHVSSHHRILTGFWEPPPINSKLIVRLGKINFHSVLLDMKRDEQWKIIVKEGYGVLYDETKFTPVAVVEHLKKENLKNKVGDREVDYYPDKELKYNIYPLGFGKMDPPSDSAHLAAAANYRYSKRAFRETFSTLNLVPMVSGVNGGVWRVIENHVRKLLIIWDDIIVICGPIYDFKSSKPQENVTGLPIFSPTHFFKIILMRRAQEEPFLQAFVVANAFSGDGMFHCRATLEEISSRTGLDLSKFSDFKYTWDQRESFICSREHCYKTFVTKTELDTHEEFHQTNCKYCGANFETAVELKLHLESHRIYQCEDCPESFRAKKHLKQHIGGVHAKTRPWICDVEDCVWAFKRKKTLKDHLVVHSDIRPHICKKEDCVASFKLSKQLIEHTNTVHATTRPWICKIKDCGSSFPIEKCLKKHMRDVHNSDGLILCTQPKCTTTFTHKTGLVSHLRNVHKLVIKAEDVVVRRKVVEESDLTRKVVSDILCTEPKCTSLFSSKDTLVRHLRTVHKLVIAAKDVVVRRKVVEESDDEEDVEESETDDGPILCTEPKCTSLFSRKSGLVRHLRRTHKLVIAAKDVVVKRRGEEVSGMAAKRPRKMEAED